MGSASLGLVRALALGSWLAVAAGCSRSTGPLDDFFVLRHPDQSEGAPVVAVTRVLCESPVEGEIRLGSRWGAEVWVDGERVHARRRRRPRTTRLDSERISIHFAAGEHDLALRFLNGPATVLDSTRVVESDAGLVLRFADSDGRALTGLKLVAWGGVPGRDTWSLGSGAAAVEDSRRLAPDDRGWRGIPPGPRRLEDPQVLAGGGILHPFAIDPVPVVMSVDEIRAYPIKAQVQRLGDHARVELDWTGAMPNSASAFRLERTASWHQRLPVEWSLVAGSTLTGSTTFADSIPLDPEAWPWTLGTAMGRVITYRITPVPPVPLEWTAPRLVSALVLAPGFHDLDSTYRRLKEAADSLPGLVTIEQIGTSAWGNLPILAARLTGAQSTSKPAVLVVGDIHTREPFGIEIGLDLVTQLGAGYGVDSATTRLLDDAELWVVPAMNPGGWGHLSRGFPGYMRKNLADVNGDGVPTPSPLYPIEWDREPLLAPVIDTIYLEGIDLNRNFDPQWKLETGSDSGSPIPGMHKYRGPHPFSEPETQAIRDLALRERFVFSLFYHEPGDRFYFLRGTAEEDLFTQLAERVGRPGRKQPGDWSGCSLAFMYLEAGTIDFTIEGATHARGDAEWLLAPRAAARDSVSAHHQGIVRKLLRIAADSGLHGRVIDGRTGKPVQATLEIWQSGDEPRRRVSTDPAGNFHRYLLPGVYSVETRVEGAGTAASHRVEILDGRPTRLELVLRGPA